MQDSMSRKGRPGRPPVENPKDDVIAIPIEPSEKARLQRLADADGVTLPEFVRRKLATIRNK